MKKYLPSIALVAIFFVVSFILLYGVRLKSQSFNFQDESEHLSFGWMMGTYQKSLYKDLVTNHQPIPVLWGFLITSIIRFNTLFDFVEKIRISAFLLFSVVGAFLTFRFRWKGLLAYSLTYLVGFYYFAWHILAESLVIPAVLFLFLFCLEKYFSHVKNIQQKFDYVLAGSALFLVAFSLLPLWPFVVLMAGLLLFKANKTEKIYLLSTLFLLTLILFSFISPQQWYQRTVMDNWLYFIPYENKVTLGSGLTILTMPFQFLFAFNDSVGRGFALATLLGLGAICFLLRKKTFKQIGVKNLVIGLFLYGTLISLNTRVKGFPIFFFNGFHFYPFVAGFFALFSWLFISILEKIHNNKTKVVLGILPVIIGIVISPWLFEKTNKLDQYYVQYGTQDSYSRVMIQLKQPNDTFFSEPDGYGYMNMRSGLPIAGRLLFHLQWSYYSPELRLEFHELMENHPPTFIYLTEDSGDYYRDLQPYLKSIYTEILHSHKGTFFYILKDRVPQVTVEQRKYLQEQDFSFAGE